ncbi:MAG: hypothetical protein AAGI13_10420 [Pseudomonadota bacterium]
MGYALRIILAVLAVSTLSACGKRGDPKPPAPDGPAVESPAQDQEEPVAE